MQKEISLIKMAQNNEKKNNNKKIELTYTMVMNTL